MHVRRQAVGLLIALASVLPAAAEGGGANALIQPHIGTIFWTLVTFVLLAFLLGKLAWKPLLGALEDREKSIRGDLQQARENRSQAEALLKEQRELLDQTRRERADALAAGQRDAETLKAEILDEARSQREQMLKQSQEQVQAGLRQAHGELRATAVDLALRAAEKLLARNLDDPTQRKLVESYLADLEDSGGSRSLPS